MEKFVNSVKPGLGLRDVSETKDLGHTAGQIVKELVKPAKFLSAILITVVGIATICSYTKECFGGNSSITGEARRQVNNGSFRNHGRR